MKSEAKLQQSLIPSGEGEESGSCSLMTETQRLDTTKLQQCFLKCGQRDVMIFLCPARRSGNVSIFITKDQQDVFAYSVALLHTHTTVTILRSACRNFVIPAKIHCKVS